MFMKLRRISSLIVTTLLAAYGFRGQPAFAGTAEHRWQEVKGEHFIVYHTNSQALAEGVCRKAEDWYAKITSDMGFTKRDDFWTWDKRVKVYLYSSKEEFAADTGAPAWAGGKASTRKKEIATFAGHEDFMESVLPHELTHLVLRDFVGFEGEIPLWLSEGLAQWEEKAKRETADKRVAALRSQNRLASIDQLTRMDVKTLEKSNSVAEFYAQAVSLVGYLIRQQGAEGFRKLCGQIRDGKNMDEALKFAYPDTIRNMKEMEQAWKKSLAETPEVTAK